MHLFGIIMLEKVKDSFSSLEKGLKTIAFLLIPFMAFFLVLSDRTPYNYFAFALFGFETIVILIHVIKYHRIVFDVYAKLLLLFLFSIFLSQILNLRPLEYPRTILLLSAFSFVFYQFAITLSTKEKDNIYELLVLGGLFFIVYFSISYFKELIKFDFSSRLGREFSDQNDLAKNLAIFGIISELLAFKKKRKKTCIIYIALAIVFFFFILVTGSISNLLSFTTIAIVLILVLSKNKQRLITLIIIVAFSIAFVGLLQLPFMNYFKTRIENMFNSFTSGSGAVDNSFVDRFFLAGYGLKLFISKPVFGYGYDQVQYYTFGKNAFSHNNFVELLGSFGVVGFIVFESLLVYPIVKNWKKRNDRCLAIFTILYLFVFQFFLIIFRKKIEYFLFPLAFSMIDYKATNYYELLIKDKKISIKKNCFKKAKDITNHGYYLIDI